MSWLFPSYQEWCRKEDEWREEVKWRLLNKKIQTAEDMEPQAFRQEEDPVISREADQAQAADMDPVQALGGPEMGEQAGFDAAAAPDPGMDGGMDAGFDGGVCM